MSLGVAEVHPQARLRSGRSRSAAPASAARPGPWPPRAPRRPAPGSGLTRRSAPAAACRGHVPSHPAAAAPRSTRTHPRRCRRPCRSAARCIRRASTAARPPRSPRPMRGIVAGAVEAPDSLRSRLTRGHRSRRPSCQCRLSVRTAVTNARPAGETQRSRTPRSPGGRREMIPYAAERAVPTSDRRPPTHPARRRARQQTQPAGRSSRAATVGDHPDRVQPVLPGEQGQRRIMIPHLGRHRVVGLQRDVRRVGDHQVHGAVELDQRGRPCRRRAARPGCRPGCAGRTRLPPATSPPRGCRVRVTSLAIALAIAPEPVHSSTTSGRCGRVAIDARCSIAQPVITSVSGRGTNTPGPTSTLDATGSAPGRSGAAAEPARPAGRPARSNRRA